jgi:hypothetical protein
MLRSVFKLSIQIPPLFLLLLTGYLLNSTFPHQYTQQLNLNTLILLAIILTATPYLSYNSHRLTGLLPFYHTLSLSFCIISPMLCPSTNCYTNRYTRLSTNYFVLSIKFKSIIPTPNNNLNSIEWLQGATDIQVDSGGICNTFGNDGMCDSKQKNSYGHGSDFERLPRLW